MNAEPAWPSPRRRWAAPLAAALSGLFFPLAFAPHGWFPLAVLSPALLFLLWRGATPARAFRTGLLYGMAWFGAGVWWLYISLTRFGGAPPVLGGGLTLLLVAWLALFTALQGWLYRRFMPDDGWRGLVLFLPAAWVLSEWLRGWLLSGFPWLSLGYSQVDSWLAGWAPVLGVYGVSWMVALSAGLLALAWVAAGRRRVFALAALLVIWGLGAGLLRIEWSQASGGAQQLVLVQGNVEQGFKWKRKQRLATLRLYRDLTRGALQEAAPLPADLPVGLDPPEGAGGRAVVLWPETAVPMFLDQVPGPWLDGLKRLLRRHGAELLLGVPVQEADGGYYNSMVRLEDGSAYRKHHLVPFGEFMPLRSLIGGLLTALRIPMADFRSGGARQPLLRLAGVPVGISICYEDIFPEEVLRTVPEAAYLINASNDAWFGDSAAPHQHLQMARMRALETARPMVRVTNTGVSAVTDHKGRVIARSPQFVPHVLTTVIQPRTGTTPYVLWGNALVLLLALSALVSAWMRWRKQPTPHLDLPPA
jgi:apolipoprotein N-acyltransferase